MTFPAASCGRSGVPLHQPPWGLWDLDSCCLIIVQWHTACEVPDPAGRPAGFSRLAGDALQSSSRPAVSHAPLDEGQSLGSGPPPWPAQCVPHGLPPS